MSSTFDRRSLLVAGVAAAAGIAGASALDWESIAGATTNGPGRNGISKGKPKRGGSLVFGTDAEETGFNPTTASFDNVGVMYARTVFDPLTIMNAAGTWEPYLAQSVTPNATYTSWTVTLRPNVLFHDGTPCDGAAMLANFRAQKSSLLVGIIIGSILDTITQTGPLSVTLTFNTPWAPFPLYLAGGIGGQNAYLMAQSMLANPNGTSNPVGTGPFVFKEWEPNSHFTATANPHYWRPGLPYLDEITYKPIPDEATRAEALQSGTIDIMVTDVAQTIIEFRGNKDYSYIDDSTHLVGEPDMDSVMLNCNAAPFDNPKVRLAAAMALNPKQYAQVIDRDVCPVSTGLFTPGSPYYSKTSYPKYNPTEARKLLKEVAASTGKPVAFTLSNTDAPTDIRQSEYEQQAFQEVGFQVTNKFMDQNELLSDAETGKYQAACWRQFSAVDPDLNYIFWSTTTAGADFAVNMARNTDPKVQSALELGRSSTDPTIRTKAYQVLNQRLAIDLPYLWLDRAVWAVVSTPKIQNWNNPTTPKGAAAFGMIGGSIWPTQIWIS
ncbi:MAG: ABC transporter substrate-binding protein [Acidimicrobiales bacterium]|jgi:ABC-type transport system substrate-binding protein